MTLQRCPQAVALLLLAFAVSVLPADEPNAKPTADFESPVEPLAPKSPRGEREQDRVDAAALFAHGRILFQRRQFDEALRRYQRAWRYDPDAVSILPEIVSLANNLGRPDEAARYAVIAVERTELDPQILRRLGLLLSARDERKLALQLLEKAVPPSPPAAKPNAARPGETDPPPQPAGDETDRAIAILQSLEMGRLYFLTDNFPKAAAWLAPVGDVLDQPAANDNSLRKMVQSQADRTLAMLAVSLFQIGSYDEAEKRFRQVYPGDQQAGRLAFELARIAAVRGQTDAALGYLEKYFSAKESAEGLEPYQLLATLLAKRHGTPEAAKLELLNKLTTLVTNDPDNEPLGLFAGQQLREQQQWAEAAAVFAKHSEKHATVDSEVGLILSLLKLDDPGRTLPALGAALLRSGSLADLPEVEEALKQDPAATERLLTHAAKLKAAGVGAADTEKLSAATALAAAWLAQRAQKRDSADEFYRLAGGAGSGEAKGFGEAAGRVTLGWGLELLLAKQHDRSAAVFQQAIDDRLSPDDNDTFRLYLIRALVFADKHDQALQVALQAASSQPKLPRFQAQPAWVLYVAKRYDDADAAYRKLLATFDKSQDSPFVRDELRDARLVLSNISLRLGRRAEAEEWLEQVLDEFPDDIGAMNDLAYLWAEQGKRLTRALAMSQHAVAGDPDNAAYLDSLGWAFYQLGRYAEALPPLEKATAGEEPDGVLLDHLGDVYSKLQQPEKAVAAWRRAAAALEKSGEIETLEKMKTKLRSSEK